MSVAGGVGVIPTCLKIYILFIPKAFIKEVVIPQTNKILVKVGWLLPLYSYWYILVCGSLWQPLKVCSVTNCVATAQFIPLRRITKSSMKYFLGPNFIIL